MTVPCGLQAPGSWTPPTQHCTVPPGIPGGLAFIYFQHQDLRI